LGLAALVAVVVAFAQTWDRSRAFAIPGWEKLLGAAVLILVGLVCGANGWLYLLERRGSRRLAATFYLSQIGKYLPGAIWQPAGQLAMAVAEGVPAASASTAVAVYMLTLIAAGGTVGLGVVVFGADLSTAARLIPLAGLVPVALLRRAWMALALDRLHSRVPRIPSGEVVPGQPAIVASYLWGIGVMIATGAAFYLLATAYTSKVGPATAVAAFAFAWTVGFLAIPVPAGLGVREALLVATLGSAIRPGAVLATSLVYRLVSIVAEVAMVGVTRSRSRPLEE
jgi:uncharacterized membrane protein YbhN (UPF0104 family)